MKSFNLVEYINRVIKGIDPKRLSKLSQLGFIISIIALTIVLTSIYDKISGPLKIVIFIFIMVLISLLFLLIAIRISNMFKEISDSKDIQLLITIEALKKTQHQLVEAEKHSSLSGLVAGVAHEINTPIGVCVTASSNLNYKIDEFIKINKNNTFTREELLNLFNFITESADIILRNTEKASNLIKSFKQIAVDQNNELKRKFIVLDYLEELKLSLKPILIKAKATLNLYCTSDLEITTYPGALSQAITNLVINSINHGFEDKENGTINIEVSFSNTDITIIYSDDGKGMAKETLTKIYDPFFTTKRGRGGTGLGLYIVYNIITQKLHGSISSFSEQNIGTTFKIQIPNCILKTNYI